MEGGRAGHGVLPTAHLPQEEGARPTHSGLLRFHFHFLFGLYLGSSALMQRDSLLTRSCAVDADRTSRRGRSKTLRRPCPRDATMAFLASSPEFSELPRSRRGQTQSTASVSYRVGWASCSETPSEPPCLISKVTATKAPPPPGWWGSGDCAEPSTAWPAGTLHTCSPSLFCFCSFRNKCDSHLKVFLKLPRMTVLQKQRLSTVGHPENSDGQ